MGNGLIAWLALGIFYSRIKWIVTSVIDRWLGRPAEPVLQNLEEISGLKSQIEINKKELMRLQDEIDQEAESRFVARITVNDRMEICEWNYDAEMLFGYNRT